MQEIIISVGQLGNYIKQIFDAEEMLYDISVKGEISGFRIFRNIAYFDLKDEICVMPCVCFNGNDYSSIRNGDSVVVRGTPRFYVKGGRLSFNVNKISPAGQGDLFLKYLRLKEQLEKEGLFALDIKKPLPKTIKRIGVISSPTGAVIEDIINVATRRNPSIDIVLYPSKVQGAGADREVIKGIDFFENYDVDLIIVARGGGSFEDLDCFNSEDLARRVFACNKVIISAIGHETDYTILDFVADLRAPTPSASAELAVEDFIYKKTIFNNKVKKFITLGLNIINQKKHNLDYKLLKLSNAVENKLEDTKFYLSLIETKLEKLNPNNILKMGYAKISKNKMPITSKNQLHKEDKIEIVLKDGVVLAEILGDENDKN